MILDDLKTDLGITGTSSDAYLLKYGINPGVVKATTLSTNVKLTTITLTTGTQSYDLTSSAIASPVVSAAGVQDLMWDVNYPWAYDYKVDFYIQDSTTLYFVDSTIPVGGELKLKYNEFFSNATDSVDTDAPDILHPSIKKWALAEIGLKELSRGAAGESGGSVEEKSEEGMRIKFGAISSNKETLLAMKSDAENEMIDLGANSGFNFFSIQAL